MNIYACWYNGLPGYCFEHPHSGWWFVPERDRPDSTPCRHLHLLDFIFVNAREWRFEVARLQQPRPSLWQRLLNRWLGDRPPRTVAGLLLLPINQY
ncbi:hypothetical protein J2T55_001810 [Methylohalomonas lacus]|uniref:Uncharacterized protein n=1 Tax=Methylohalomonas lacus TaxID=398773 RepID=A0AAE3HNL4_9GAMM|nr:hypothetical protein [Methylohalomonas lacus]MCS3903778.1 hypothetical protein [Methylohalomonas lacus]